MSKVELSTEPSNTINEGDTILMFCNVKSSEALSYSWFHDGNLLQDHLQYKIINSVQLKDQGKYRCVAKHPVIGQKSSPFNEISANCK